MSEWWTPSKLQAWRRRSKPLTRKTALKASRKRLGVNRKRAAKRREKCFGEQAERCRRLPCAVCYPGVAVSWPRERPVLIEEVSHAHHEPPRSCGGVDRDTVPLCWRCHHERHAVGRLAFEHKHRIDLRAIAARIHEEMKKEKTG